MTNKQMLMGLVVALIGGGFAWLKSDISEIRQDVSGDIKTVNEKIDRQNELIMQLYAKFAEKTPDAQIKLYPSEMRSVMRYFENNQVKVLLPGGIEFSATPELRAPAQNETIMDFKVMHK